MAEEKKSPVVGWIPLVPSGNIGEIGTSPVVGWKKDALQRTLKEQIEIRGETEARKQFGLDPDVSVSKLPSWVTDERLEEIHQEAASEGMQVEFVYLPEKSKINNTPDVRTASGKFFGTVDNMDAAPELQGKWYEVVLKDGEVKEAVLMS
jgi:hypothetical protein